MSSLYEKQKLVRPSHDQADVERLSPVIDQEWTATPMKKTWRRSYLCYLLVILMTGTVVFLLLGCATSSSDSTTSVNLPADATFPYHYGPVVESKDTTSINSTFGFEKIYIINLPRRTDKKAEFTILAEEYGLDIEFVDGVEGTKLIPNDSIIRAGILGVAEGHARCWEKMVKDKVTSAIVFEDDFDFDVRIVRQLAMLRDPFQAFLTLMDKTRTPPQKLSPKTDPFYSQAWDLFWWAPQSESAWPLKEGEKDKRPLLSYEDPTTVDPKVEAPWVNAMMKSYGLEEDRRKGLSSGRVRYIQPVLEVFGTSSYAVSLSGAKKLLYENAHKGDLIDHIDTIMHWMANDNKIRAYSVTPPLFSHFQSHLGNGLDSDREHTKHIPLPGVNGVSEGVEISARKTLLQKLNGNMNKHWYYHFDRKVNAIVAQ